MGSDPQITREKLNVVHKSEILAWASWDRKTAKVSWSDILPELVRSRFNKKLCHKNNVGSNRGKHPPLTSSLQVHMSIHSIHTHTPRTQSAGYSNVNQPSRHFRMNSCNYKQYLKDKNQIVKDEALWPKTHYRHVIFFLSWNLLNSHSDWPAEFICWVQSPCPSWHPQLEAIFRLSSSLLFPSHNLQSLSISLWMTSVKPDVPKLSSQS